MSKVCKSKQFEKFVYKGFSTIIEVGSSLMVMSLLCWIDGTEEKEGLGATDGVLRKGDCKIHKQLLKC